MSTATLIGLIVTLVAISLLISAACYTLIAKLFRAEKPTLWRGLAVAAFSVAASILMSVWLRLATNAIETNPGLSLLAMLVVNLIAPALVTAGVFRTSVPRALGIFFGASLLGGGIAFAMALAVKATIVETFVIPTGSMAPTVRGAHMERECRNCGRELIVGMTGEAIQGADEFRPRGVEAECVNCGQLNKLASNGDDSRGERIAVDKLSDVDRWDLVVFRKPDEREVNYVKRFVGLPGEQIEWHGGELFADGKLLRKLPGRMNSLWFPVNDSAFMPKEAGDRGWKSADNDPAWRRLDSRWIGIPTKDAAASLRFVGKIDDEFAYSGRPPRRNSIVTDIMVRLTGVFTTTGIIAFDWKYGGIAIRFEIDSGAEMLRIQQTEPAAVELANAKFEANSLNLEPIEFAIRDGQAYVRRAGVTVAGGEFGPATLADYRRQFEPPIIRKEPCELEITARGEQVGIGRIELFRDIYYLSTDEIGAVGPDVFARPNEAIQLGDDAFLALGDNSDSALDSRFWGPVPREKIIGVAKWLYWPPKRAQEFE